MNYPPYYDLFLKCIETYGPTGFTEIDPRDPLIMELEEIMEKNDQFFYFGDLMLFQIIYTSKRCKDMLGVEPALLSGFNFFQSTHPDELNRHLLGRTTLLKLAHELYKAEKGFKIISTTFRIKNAAGQYNNMLVQFYIYFSHVPYKSVFTINVHTNINWFKKARKGYHYYLGDDLLNFRYPDRELLMLGNVFSRREFEIIKMLEKGLSSEKVAEMLFLSLNTVNTHRRNILLKSGKDNMFEVIFDLKERGLM
jgi:hypothetical protein